MLRSKVSLLEIYYDLTRGNYVVCIASKTFPTMNAVEIKSPKMWRIRFLLVTYQSVQFMLTPEHYAPKPVAQNLMLGVTIK